nr:MAG TPA: hypothetical protein [Caudoviricetes sp.]
MPKSNLIKACARCLCAHVRRYDVARRHLVCHYRHDLNSHTSILFQVGIVCNRLDAIHVFISFAEYSKTD